MVLAYLPQRMKGSLITNSNYTPQGIGGDDIIPPVESNPLLVLYPPFQNENFSKDKHYQVNKGEFATPQTNFIWKITDSVGPGIFQEASGFDIRPFLLPIPTKDLTNASATGNNFDPGFLLNVIQLSDDQLHLFGWEFGGTIHEWVLSGPAVFPADGTPSDFQFTPPSETNGRDIKFLDEGTKMSIAGEINDTVELYKLTTKNSLSTTPELLDSFDLSLQNTTISSCDYSADGMKLYVLFRNADTLNQWNLTERLKLPAPGTLPDRTFPFNPPVTASNGNNRMSPDGSFFYIISTDPDQINKYFTDGKDNIPTVNANPVSTFDTSFLEGNTRAMSVSLDGSHIWFSGRGMNILFELELPPGHLFYEVTSVNITTGDFTIKVLIPTMEDLTFIQIVFGDLNASDKSTPLGSGTTLSTSVKPLLTKDEDNFLVDSQGRNITELK